MYLANPKYDTESLLANASETLGSATTMLNNFAALLDTSHRKTALGVAQIVMLGELAVNQALDKSCAGGIITKSSICSRPKKPALKAGFL